MDAVTIDALPSSKSLLNSKVPESTDNPTGNNDGSLYIDELDEDDEIRLRLSDDEDIEQGNASGHIQSQQTNSQLDSDDLEFDVNPAVASEGTSKLYHNKLNGTTLVEGDNISNNNSLDDNINENSTDKELEMSGNDRGPPLMHNSPKYWSNNGYDKRWRKSNSSRDRTRYSQRNGKDWYNQQFPDKFNQKNHVNSQNNHYNRIRNTRSFNNLYKENHSESVRKEERNESPKTKKVENETPQVVAENGVSDEKQLSEKDSSFANHETTNENTKLDDEDAKNSLTNSEQKNEKEEDLHEKACIQNSEESKTISSRSSIVKNDEIKSDNQDSESVKCVENGALSSPKDCDLSMTESEMRIRSELKSDEVNSSSSKEKNVEMNNSSSTDGQLESKSVANQNDYKEESEAAEAAPSGSIEKENECENSTKSDNINGDCNIESVTNDNGGSLSGEAKDSNINLREHEQFDENSKEKIDSEECNNEIERKLDNTNESNDKKSSSDELNLSLNVSSNPDTEGEKSTAQDDMEISTAELDNGSKSPKLSERMDISNEEMAIDNNPVSADLPSVVISDENTDANNLKLSILLDTENSSETPMLKNKDNLKLPTLVIRNQENKSVETESGNSESEKIKINEQEKVNNIIEEVDLVDDDTETEVQTNIEVDENTTSSKDTTEKVPINEDDQALQNTPIVHKKRRRKKKTLDVIFDGAATTDEFGVRQKRRSAKNAEEMIRKEIQRGDEEENSSDGSEKIVTINYKKSKIQGPSPLTLKRTLEEIDSVTESVTLKRIKPSSAGSSSTSSYKMEEIKDEVKSGLNPLDPREKTNVIELVRKTSQEDIRERLKNLNREEIEAIVMAKIVESLTFRGENGRLREEVRALKKSQEASRTMLQTFRKQVEGFDMVLKRITYDKNTNEDKYLPPIKINRSVGLQVNFQSQEHGIQSLKQVQATKMVQQTNIPNNLVITKTTASNPNAVQDNNPRKVLKTNRSPRRPDMSLPSLTVNPMKLLPSTYSGSPTSIGQSTETSHKRLINGSNSGNVVQLIQSPQQQQQQQHQQQQQQQQHQQHQQSIIVNTPVNRNIASQKSNVTNKTSDLIDLTDEEDKSKTAPTMTPITTNTRFPTRVLQAVPASVVLTTNNPRIVQAASQMSQATLVNNTARQVYVMQSGMSGGTTRQIVLTNSNTMRTAPNISTVTAKTMSTVYKQVPTLGSGVKLLTAQPITSIQIARQHPAPLPEVASTESNPGWKLPPPPPTLKISKVQSGIVLSWNMILTDKYAEIVSYQLYAYQEVAGTNPNAALWKKVGDVRALPLPMACTLTQFTEGNNYYFAVRAVDVHSRFGAYSKPGNISL